MPFCYCRRIKTREKTYIGPTEAFRDLSMDYIQFIDNNWPATRYNIQKRQIIDDKIFFNTNQLIGMIAAITFITFLAAGIGIVLAVVF
jgi:hypothetical protein